MSHHVVFDVSALRSWAVRGLVIGLADHNPPLLIPRWSGGTLAELRRLIESALERRRRKGAASAASAILESISACLPDAEVPDTTTALEAAERLGARTIVTGSAPIRAHSAGIASLDLDAFLVRLHTHEPWRMLHVVALYAFTLRRPDRATDDLLATLASEAPRFVRLIRSQIAGLPANQPASVLARPPDQIGAADESGDDWWCIGCDPFPCPGDDVLHLQIAGVAVTCLPDGECCYVGVTQTVQHSTLVWASLDDPILLEIAHELDQQCRNPRVIPYRASLGPATSYWEWEATGNPVHGVHHVPPPSP